MSENAIVPESATLYAKMAAVMGGVENIPKDGYNKFHKYHYATSDAVTSVIRKLMAEQKLAFFVDIVKVNDEGGKYVVEYLYTFACGDTGATHSCTWYGEAQNTNSKGGIDDKALAKAATIAQKYFLMKTFNISTGDDEDTDSNQNGKSQTTKPAKPVKGTKKIVKVANREVKQSTKRDKVYNLFRTSEGDMIAQWTRQPFIERHYCTENDWNLVGETQLLDFTCTVEADKKGYWEFVVDTIPPYDPEWEGLAEQQLANELTQQALMESGEGDLGSDHYANDEIPN